MDNPGTENAAIPEVTEQVSIEEQVNKAVKAMTFDETKEVWNLPDGLPEEVKVAATAEKRRRDTQASLTKSNQRLKALEEANQLLRQELTSKVTVSLTTEQSDELEELKYSDPEAWREKLNQYEHQARIDLDSKLNDTLSQADIAVEKQRRETVLANFIAANPGAQVNDDVIADNVPPKLTKQLELGAISFDDFLEQAKDYLIVPGTAIANNEVPGAANMSSVGGGADVPAGAVDEDIITTYRDEVY